MTAQSSIPVKWYVPFANSDANRVEIPVTTSDATRASQQLGFPPLTMQPPESGGVPPQGEDFNGALNQVARIAWWVLNGGGWLYDSTFATNSNINGYPKGATLQAADFQGEWISTSDNNAVNPDTLGTGWIPGYQYGSTAVAGLTTGTTTLTPLQAAKNFITLAGTLTGAVTIVLPNWIKSWTITNNTSGAFAVIVKTAAGSGVTIPQNGTPTRVIGDGTNINQQPDNIAAATSGTHALQVNQQVAQTFEAFTAGGTAPAYTLTPSPALTALTAGTRYRAKFTANGTTGTNTINVSGLGAVALQQFGSDGTLVSAPIVANQLTDIEYNGSVWVVMDPVASLGHGQCRLSVTSTTQITLKPYNGNGLIVGGVPVQIPSAGVTVTNSGLAASTLYYVYAFLNSGVLSLECVTTSHVTQPSNGVEVKSTDSTRTLVGMVYTNASTQFVDSLTSRTCLNWFQRRQLVGNAQGNNLTFTNTTAAEVSTAVRVQFLAWADEGIYAGVDGYLTANNAPYGVSAQSYMDGAAWGPIVTDSVGTANYNFGYSSANTNTLTEGLHTAQVYANLSGSGPTGTLVTLNNKVITRG
jgi:hypothetical protein